jgi:hypothetical protein
VFLGIGDCGVIFMFEDMATSVGLALIGGGGRVTYGNQQGGFQIVAGYQRLFRGRLSAGVTASWAGSSKTVFLNREDSGKIERQMLTLMADGRAALAQAARLGPLLRHFGRHLPLQRRVPFRDRR